MDAILLTAISLIVGGILSAIISRYYFKKTFQHKLGVYLIDYSRVFSNMDSSIRKDLSIRFRGVAVEQLTIASFLIANEGVNAIRAYIKPLTFSFSSHAVLLDASLPYVAPDGRQIAITRDDEGFACEFDILNPGEYFVAKALINGDVRRKDIKVSITAENLPPQLVLEGQARIASENTKKVELFPLVLGSIFLAAGLAIAEVLRLLYEVQPTIIPFLSDGKPSDIAVIEIIPMGISAIIAIIFFVFGLIAMVAAVFGSLPRRSTFKLPHRLISGRFYGVGYPSVFVDEQDRGL